MELLENLSQPHTPCTNFFFFFFDKDRGDGINKWRDEQMLLLQPTHSSRFKKKKEKRGNSRETDYDRTKWDEIYRWWVDCCIHKRVDSVSGTGGTHGKNPNFFGSSGWIFVQRLMNTRENYSSLREVGSIHFFHQEINIGSLHNWSRISNYAPVYQLHPSSFHTLKKFTEVHTKTAQEVPSFLTNYSLIPAMQSTDRPITSYCFFTAAATKGASKRSVKIKQFHHQGSVLLLSSFFYKSAILNYSCPAFNSPTRHRINFFL